MDASRATDRPSGYDYAEKEPDIEINADGLIRQSNDLPFSGLSVKKPAS